MANQYQIDPRQTLFMELWTNPKSETFSNAYRSALKAGYSEDHAKTLTAKTDWVTEKHREITKDQLMVEAKKVLARSLKSQDEKIAQDTAKFIAKTDPEFSEKVENTLVLPKPLLGGASVSDNNSDQKAIEA